MCVSQEKNSRKKMNFEERLQNCSCAALTRQRAFGEYLSGRNWNVDLALGIVKFGEDLVFPIQLLGSFSDLSGTWMWAWENPGSDRWNKKCLEGVNKLKLLGDIFEIPTFELENITGHEIAMVCSNLLGDIPYYRGPYENGALFFLVLDIPKDFNVQISTLTCVNTIMNTIANSFITNHKAMAQSFLKSQNFQIEEDFYQHIIKGKRGEEEILLEFNEDGFLSTASTHLSANK